jgi:hypothetical protein
LVVVGGAPGRERGAVERALGGGGVAVGVEVVPGRRQRLAREAVGDGLGGEATGVVVGELSDAGVEASLPSQVSEVGRPNSSRTQLLSLRAVVPALGEEEAVGVVAELGERGAVVQLTRRPAAL